MDSSPRILDRGTIWGDTDIFKFRFDPAGSFLQESPVWTQQEKLQSSCRAIVTDRKELIPTGWRQQDLFEPVWWIKQILILAWQHLQQAPPPPFLHLSAASQMLESSSDVESPLMSAACANRRPWEISCWESLEIFCRAHVEERDLTILRRQRDWK